ncbi:MAG: helix-turn-helix domain-containing protein [Anaerolineales bacterium]|nr:helix-turn-helix domain-containing protein [Anaerolineales bacterium]
MRGRRIATAIKQEIVEKVQAGERVADLADQYGVSTKTIYGWLRQDTGEAVGHEDQWEIVATLVLNRLIDLGYNWANCRTPNLSCIFQGSTRWREYMATFGVTQLDPFTPPSDETIDQTVDRIFQDMQGDYAELPLNTIHQSLPSWIDSYPISPLYGDLSGFYYFQHFPSRAAADQYVADLQCMFAYPENLPDDNLKLQFAIRGGLQYRIVGTLDGTGTIVFNNLIGANYGDLEVTCR